MIFSRVKCIHNTEGTFYEGRYQGTRYEGICYSTCCFCIFMTSPEANRYNSDVHGTGGNLLARGRGRAMSSVRIMMSRVSRANF